MADPRVTDEMVDRALDEWFEEPQEDWEKETFLTKRWRADMRRVLERALSAAPSPPARAGWCDISPQ